MWHGNDEPTTEGVNEEKGLSFMRYTEDESVQKIIPTHLRIWRPIKYWEKSANTNIQTLQKFPTNMVKTICACNEGGHFQHLQ